MGVMQDILPVSSQELSDDDDISVEQRIFIRDLADKGYTLIHTPLCAYCGSSIFKYDHQLDHPKLGHI